MKKLFIISGPTASGKSKIAIKLAKKFNFEIINADSIQVYKKFDIGTSKPSLEEFKIVKHHLFSIKEPWEPYTNSDYVKDVNKVLNKNSKKYLLVGGTGFYINSLLYGTFHIPTFNNNLNLLNIFKNKTKSQLYQDLLKIDPETAKRFHENDTYRTKRALSVYYGTGKTMTYYRTLHEKNFNSNKFEYKILSIKLSKDDLKTRIQNRTKLMIKNGLINEVEELIKDIRIINSKPIKSIGYNEIFKFLNGEIALDKAINDINSNTYKLAKRQGTWLKKRDNVIFIDPVDSYNKIEDCITNFYLKD